MGAWGTGVFDDDTACDIIGEAIDDELPAEVLVKKAINVPEDDYLESDDGLEIIVAGAVVDALINGTSYTCMVEGFDTWLSKQNVDTVVPHKSALVDALQIVLSDDSEINELWAENEEAYPAWKGNIESIIKGLRA